MEFEWNIFPEFTNIAARRQSPRVHEQNERTRTIPRTHYLHVDDIIMKRNVLLIPHLCLYLQKDIQQDMGLSSDLDQKQSGILLTTKDHEEHGIESLN